MVIVKDIDFSSLCEHHMLPFFGPGARVLHPRWQGSGSEQDSAHCGDVRPALTSARADDEANRLTHPGGVAPAGCGSGGRGGAYVQHDAWREEA
jgi:hypothetical protein